MIGRFPRAPLLLGGIVLLALPLGCLVPNVRTDAPAAPRPDTDTYRLVTGEARSLAGCRYDYRVYEPLAPGSGSTGTVTVLLGHGFLRDQDKLIGLGRALANAGHRAVTLDFCNMRPWNGHHARNGADLRALAGRLADGPLVYAGFSAGALAAVLAASADRRADDDGPVTLGVVTLDLVDQAGLAENALRTLDVPLVALQGPPSGCNAYGNGQAVIDRYPNARLEKLPGASHCEFESPTGPLCEIFCGDEDEAAGDERVRERIVGHVVDAVDELARSDESARTAAAPRAPGM